jgi:hypothetical protein
MKIRFTRGYDVKDDSAKHYDEGDEVTLSEASAMHFVNRGAAVIVTGAGVEVASVEPPETAVARRGKPRKVAADAAEADAKRSAD